MNSHTLRQQLTNLTGSSGGHKEQADRYRALLEQILSSQDPNQSEFLKIFIEASKSKLFKQSSCLDSIIYIYNLFQLLMIKSV